MRRLKQMLLTVILWPAALPLATATEPIASWGFVPEYKLPGRAANYPGPRPETPNGHHPLVAVDSSPLLFQGGSPTERLRNFLAAEKIPRNEFSIELWICHHVNQPVTAVIAAKGKQPGSLVPWSLSFGDWKSILTMQNQNGSSFELRNAMPRWGGFKERWIHLVATYDGHHAKLYVNGQSVAEAHLHANNIAWPDDIELELAAYMNREPYMRWANLVNGVWIYDRPLSSDQIEDRFRSHCGLVEDGKLFADLFHFTAGPYLNLATTNSISLTCETDRPAKATIRWGKTAELDQSLELDNTARLQEAVIEGLEPETPYFYRIDAVDDTGEEISSGLLTFRTAVPKGKPFRFAVIGDTESRPHINDRLSNLIWNERPNFLINLGDLTDGGKKPHRYEWTHEYFLGMTQLTSRVPVFAVPGNGEGDLYWYKHYHRYPTPEGYYKFEFGDAAFFMLDSNRRQTDFKKGGKQYVWLDKQLAACDAKWKFVCHHHATFTSEEDDYGNTWEGPTTFGDMAVREIVPLYEKHGVDMVMFGHLHLFERSLPMKDGKVDFENGTIHLLAGGGGGNLEDFSPTPAFFSAKTHRGHHYLLMEMHGDSLTMRMHDLNGAIRDSFSIQKSAPGRLRTFRSGEDKAALNR